MTDQDAGRTAVTLPAGVADAKGAINAFTEVLATQLAPRGIRVNAGAPGPT